MCCEAVHTRFRQDRGDCGPRSSSPSHSVPFLPLISWLRDPQSICKRRWHFLRAMFVLHLLPSRLL